MKILIVGLGSIGQRHVQTMEKVINAQFIIDNKTVTDRRIIANEFNKYFTSIASNLNNNYHNDELEIKNLPDFNEYLPKSCTSSIFLHQCTADEISKIISELENDKASDIPIKLIKQSSKINFISPSFTFN